MFSLTTSPTELTTAATDLMLFVLLLAYIPGIQTTMPAKQIRARLWQSIFFFVSIGSGLGAVLHGINGLSDQTRQMLWWFLFLFLDASIALFAIVMIEDWLGRNAVKKSMYVIIFIALLCFIVLATYESFIIFTVYQIIIMLSAMSIYLYLAVTKRLTGAWWLFAGILLMIIGAVFQALKGLSFTLIWTFDHNGIYHLVSLLGVTSLFIGLRKDLNHN